MEGLLVVRGGSLSLSYCGECIGMSEDFNEKRKFRSEAVKDTYHGINRAHFPAVYWCIPVYKCY